MSNETIPIVRLGNALLKCPNCRNQYKAKCPECNMMHTLRQEMVYLYALIIKMQTGNKAILRAVDGNLNIAESILGSMFRFGIRETKREKISEDGKEFIDIHCEVI